MSATDTSPTPAITISTWETRAFGALVGEAYNCHRMAMEPDKNVKLEAATAAVKIGLEEGRWRRVISAGAKYGCESGFTEDDVQGIIQGFRNEARGR